MAAMTAASAQSTFQETFTGTSAYGWHFGGTGYTPNLTAASGVDSVGDGWLRLTDNGNNRSTYALLDTEIFSVNAQIQIEMEYAFYNGSGADGITFFLVDGSTTVDSFEAGAYGGCPRGSTRGAAPSRTSHATSSPAKSSPPINSALTTSPSASTSTK